MSGFSSDWLYEALVDDERFADLPALLAQATKARRASVNARYADGGVDVLTCSQFDPAFLRDMAEGGWGPKDPWLLGGLKPGNQNQIFFGERIVAPAALERTEFYNELIRPHGGNVYFCLGGAFTANDGSLVTVAVFRERGDEAFGAAERAVLEEAARHVRPLVLARGLLAEERRRSAVRGAALSTFALGVLVVGRDGRLLDGNAAGEALLAAQDGLRLRAGIVGTTTLAAQRSFERLVADATAPAAPRGGALRLPRSGGGAHLLTVMPLKDGRAPAKALILIQDPTAHDEGDAVRLRALFGLTPAEAELAVLLSQGLSASEAADARGVTAETVKSQLKALTAKLGVSRQVEVAALVASLPKLRPDV